MRRARIGLLFGLLVIVYCGCGIIKRITIDGYLRPFDPGTYVGNQVLDYTKAIKVNQVVMERARIVQQIS